jgi:hypothetical protein
MGSCTSGNIHVVSVMRWGRMVLMIPQGKHLYVILEQCLDLIETLELHFVRLYTFPFWTGISSAVGRGPQLPRAQLLPFLPHSNWEAGALILLAGSFLTNHFTRSPRRKQLEGEEIQVILPSAWISVKKARSGNEASDWLATGFPAKGTARMKSNEFDTEI